MAEKKKVDILSAQQLFVVGTEGSLKIVDKEPTRVWLWGGALGGKHTWNDSIFLGGHSFRPEGRYLHDGAYNDPFDPDKRKMFYCRILPDDARQEIHQIDLDIEEIEQKLARLRHERQGLLASAARRGKRVPTPPQPPKPKEPPHGH